MQTVLDVTVTIVLCVVLLVGPAVGVLVLRDRRRARRFVPVCASCGHAGPRGTPMPEQCPACGENPSQRRVLIELERRRRGSRFLPRLSVEEPSDDPDNELFRRVFVAKEYKDIPYLIEALRDPDPNLRRTAARYLGSLEASEATQALIRLLRAGNPGVRTTAIIALGKIWAPEATPDLIELTAEDPDPGVRTHAIGALGEIGSAEAIPVLVSLLGSKDWHTRACAATALGVCGDEAVVDALRHQASRERRLARFPFRKALRRIRWQRRLRWLPMTWPLGWKTRRRLWGLAFRGVIFVAIFLFLLKTQPGL